MNIDPLILAKLSTKIKTSSKNKNNRVNIKTNKNNKINLKITKINDKIEVLENIINTKQVKINVKESMLNKLPIKYHKSLSKVIDLMLRDHKKIVKSSLNSKQIKDENKYIIKSINCSCESYYTVKSYISGYCTIKDAFTIIFNLFISIYC